MCLSAQYGWCHAYICDILSISAASRMRAHVYSASSVLLPACVCSGSCPGPASLQYPHSCLELGLLCRTYMLTWEATHSWLLNWDRPATGGALASERFYNCQQATKAQVTLLGRFKLMCQWIDTCRAFMDGTGGHSPPSMGARIESCMRPL